MTNPADHTPAEARKLFRDGLVTPTAGWCAGWAQANLLALPRDLAFDFLLFTQRNPKPCPVLDVLDAGEVSGPILDGDVRTDIPAYRVYVDGELAEETTDVTSWWREDLVAFLIGCSFTFEAALLEAGVPVRHVEQGVNVPMYRTSRRCRSADRGVDAAGAGGAGGGRRTGDGAVPRGPRRARACRRPRGARDRGPLPPGLRRRGRRTTW